MDRQPTLVGPTLRLRPLLSSDHDALAAAASDPLIWEQHPDRERGSAAGFDRFFADSLASGGALVVCAADGAVIGSSRYADDDPADGGRVEIGWTFLVRAHWGGATNRELKRLMLDHAFASVQTVVFRRRRQPPFSAGGGEARRRPGRHGRQRTGPAPGLRAEERRLGVRGLTALVHGYRSSGDVVVGLSRDGRRRRRS